MQTYDEVIKSAEQQLPDPLTYSANLIRITLSIDKTVEQQFDDMKAIGNGAMPEDMELISPSYCNLIFLKRNNKWLFKSFD